MTGVQTCALPISTNRTSIRGRQLLRRLGGDEGQKVLLDRYAQVVANSVREELGHLDRHAELPLFLFANEPLASMVQAHGLPGEVVLVPGAADELRPDQIDAAIRERIGELTGSRLSRAADRLGDGFAAGLTSVDVAQVARAAAAGAVGTLYYDLTADVRGSLDPETGADQRRTFDQPVGCFAFRRSGLLRQPALVFAPFNALKRVIEWAMHRFGLWRRHLMSMSTYWKRSYTQ